MNLFIDTISSLSIIILFDQNRNILSQDNWIARWNESSTLIPKIDSFISQNNLEYSDINNIVIVSGPGSFTWVRTTVLVVNTLAFTLGCKITPLSYFDLFDTYPIIKASSRRDCFVQLSIASDVEIIPNELLQEHLSEKNISQIYGEKLEFLSDQVTIVEKIDYESIIKKVVFEENTRIEPLYIKKPNIS